MCKNLLQDAVTNAEAGGPLDWRLGSANTGSTGEALLTVQEGS
jgi:hypothetical protein